MRTTLHFTFDGVSSEDYGLMIYYIGDPGVIEENVWEADIIEERLSTRFDPIHYGVNINKSKTLELIIGSENYIDRETVEEILDWFTSHNTYKWLEFDQDDLSDWRYKVLFSNIQMVGVNGLPFAFRCDVTFDSQYAYEYPTAFVYDIENGQVKDARGNLADYATLVNSGKHYGYYYPKMTIEIAEGCDRFTIANETDNPERKFILNIPNNFATDDGSDKFIATVDNKNQIMSCNCSNVNIYKQFGDKINDDAVKFIGNHYFVRLLKGDNKLTFEGSGTVTFNCEFLRKVGA